MATIDLGKIKLVWRGTYAGGTAYTVDDVVQHTDNGLTSSFICTTNSTGNAPSTGGSVHGSWAYLAKGGTAGTDVGTTITTQGDLLYRDGSGLQRLAKGTAGQVLKMNTAANAPEWGSDEGGGMDLVYSTDSVSTSVFNIDNVFTSTYKVYKMYVIDLYPNTDAEFQFNYRTGGSSGAISNSANYRIIGVRNERNSSGNHSVAAANDSWGLTYGRLSQSGESSNTSKVFNSEITIYNPYNNESTWMRAFTSNTDNSGAYIVGYDNVIWYHQAAVITGIALNSSAGAWSGGKVRIFGIKGS
tara:strand:+ start:159 stop:1058 length:900 start_codon:yes stop_codon:yes gene_type:complete